MAWRRSKLQAMSDPEHFNQPPPFEDVNLFASDEALRNAVEREGGGGAERDLEQFGATAGSRHMLEQARLANEIRPSSGASMPGASASIRWSIIPPITS
jgi:hypothetical protein